MPYYDLRCTSCGREFNHKASVAEFVSRTIPCPACHSTALESVSNGHPPPLSNQRRRRRPARTHRSAAHSAQWIDTSVNIIVAN